MAYYEEVTKRLKELEKSRSAASFSLGKSVRGRELWCLRIGKSRRRLFLCGATHGGEYITTEVLLRWAEISNISDECSVYIAPLLNPDGAEIAMGSDAPPFEYEGVWQANANGVDLNHNFDAAWRESRDFLFSRGYASPSPTRYAGSAAESEIETRAICDFIRAVTPDMLISLHSQGEVIYYDFNGRVPRGGYMAALLFSIASGYRLDSPVREAQGGGLKDWFIDKFDRPGFTIEIGRGKNPLPLDKTDEILLSVAPVLRIAIDRAANLL